MEHDEVFDLLAIMYKHDEGRRFGVPNWTIMELGLDPGDVGRKHLKYACRDKLWNALRLDGVRGGLQFAMYDMAVTEGIPNVLNCLGRLMAKDIEGEILDKDLVELELFQGIGNTRQFLALKTDMDVNPQKLRALVKSYELYGLIEKHYEI